MVSVSSRFSNTFVMRSALNICVTEFWFPASEPTWWNKHTSRCHPWTWMSCMCVCVCNGISLSFHFSIQFSLITTNNACFPFLVVSLLPISTYLYRLPQTRVLTFHKMLPKERVSIPVTFLPSSHGEKDYKGHRKRKGSEHRHEGEEDGGTWGGESQKRQNRENQQTFSFHSLEN